MNFSYLAKSLIPTAERAAQFFKKNQGVSSFHVEEQLISALGYRPTLFAVTPDHHYLCNEVSESPYPVPLESVVLDCLTQGLPVRLYVAFPSDVLPGDYKERVDRAHAHGVGVLEVARTEEKVIYAPLSLSLAGLRPRPKSEFPPRYRSVLMDAEGTFRGGNPVQGCLMIYSEIEALSRRVAKKTKARRLWRALKSGEKPPRINLSNGAWAKVMETLIDHLDASLCPSPNRALLNGVAGLTAQRNDHGHKPSSKAALIKRDRELRTRFENAVDILYDLIAASRHLRV